MKTLANFTAAAATLVLLLGTTQNVFTPFAAFVYLTFIVGSGIALNVK